MIIILLIIGVMVGFEWGRNYQLDRTLEQLKKLNQPPPYDFGQEDERVASNAK